MRVLIGNSEHCWLSPIMIFTALTSLWLATSYKALDMWTITSDTPIINPPTIGLFLHSYKPQSCVNCWIKTHSQGGRDAEIENQGATGQNWLYLKLWASLSDGRTDIITQWSYPMGPMKIVPGPRLPTHSKQVMNLNPNNFSQNQTKVTHRLRCSDR